MREVLEILSVAALFILRIGLPLLVLLVIGALMERSYRNRAA